MKRTARLRRGAMLARRNEKRRKARWSVAFGSRERVAFVQSLPCIVCGRGPCEAAHATSRAAGGTADDMVPLCSVHHAEQHNVGILTFETRHSVYMEGAALVTTSLWERLSA